MSYSKKNWYNLPDMSTPISATNLNHMEEGIADANGVIGVDAYDNTATYAINDLCIKDNTLYICTTAITTAEAWNSAHWKAISVKDMLISKTENNNVVTSMNKMIGFDCLNGVVESGSNQYGYYIKFGDGTMICCREISVTLDVSNTWGSLYYGQDATEWTFAKTFSEVPKVLCSIRNTSSNSCMQIGYNAPVITKSSYKNIAVARPTANSSVSVIATIFAIGRWK